MALLALLLVAAGALNNWGPIWTSWLSALAGGAVVAALQLWIEVFTSFMMERDAAKSAR